MNLINVFADLKINLSTSQPEYSFGVREIHK